MYRRTESADEIVAELRQIADNIEKSAKSVNEERLKHIECRVHLRCNRFCDMMREAADTRRLADRIEKAVKIEREKRDSAYEYAENLACDLANLVDAVKEVKRFAIECRAPCLKAKFETKDDRRDVLFRLAKINTTIEFAKPHNGNKKAKGNDD